MAAQIHTVAPGECLRSIANRHGFADPEVIWRHEDNAELRAARPSANVLAPGDRVAIPERRVKEVECADGKMHRFVVRRPPTRSLRVVFVDAVGAPITGTPYVLTLADGERRGTTDGDGAVDQKNLGVDVTTALLELPELGIRRTLRIGHLDPHHDDAGWRQRLVNLGYPGDEAGLSAFSAAHDLPADAAPEAVREKLRTVHRS